MKSQKVAFTHLAIWIDAQVSHHGSQREEGSCVLCTFYRFFIIALICNIGAAEPWWRSELFDCSW